MPRPCWMLPLLLVGCTLTFDDPPEPPAVPRGRVAGRVAPPEGFDPARLSRGRAELRSGTERMMEAPIHEDATFVFDRVAAGTYFVRALVPGARPAESAAFTLTDGDRLELEPIALAPDATAVLAGEVRLEQAGRHAGVTVASEAAVTVTRDDGRYRLAAYPGRQVLRFSFPGYTPLSLEVVAAPDGETAVEPVVLRAEPGHLRGTVRLPRGYDDPASVVAVEVELHNGDRALRTVHPERDGRFAFESVPPGTYTVTARREPFAPVSARGVVVPVAGEAYAGVLQFEPPPPVSPARVSGRALLAGAVDHAGTRVEVRGTPLTTETASDGGYALALPPRDDGYTLVLSRPGYTTVERATGALAAGKEVTVADAVLVGLPGRVEGIVALEPPPGAEAGFDPERWLPGLRARLVHVGDPEAEVQDAVVAPDGRFAFEGVPPGRYVAVFELPGFATASAPVDLPPGGVENLGRVTLRVAREGERLVHGVARRRCPGPCDHAGIRVEALQSPFSAVTGSDGAWRLRVVEGRYALRFSLPGYEPRVVEGVDLRGRAAVEVADVLLELRRTRLSGRARRLDARGRAHPAAGAAVTLRDGEAVAAVGRADDDGAFVLDVALPEGRYTLAVTLAGHAAAAVPVPLVPGHPIDVAPVTLDLQRGALAGRVAGAAGEGPVTVVLERRADPLVPSAFHATALADFEGVWRLGDLPVGAYRVAAVGPGLRPVGHADVVVAAGEEAVVEVAVAPRVHRLSVPAAPVAGPEVTVRLERDDDLRYGAVWVGDEAPEALPVLAEDAVTVALPGPGRHRVRAQVANVPRVDEAGDPFAYRSPVLEAEVVRDAAPPVVTELRLGDGSGWTRDRRLPVFVACHDDWTAAGALELALLVDGVPAEEGPLRRPVVVDLAGDDGPRTVQAVCRDAAGNEGQAEAAIVLDTAPPVVRRVALNGGTENEPTRDRVVDVHLDIEGAVAVAIVEEGALDCAAAPFVHPPAGTIPLALRGGDGPRRVHVCGRDAAGNVSAPAASNTVVLDTVPPRPAAVTLAGGARWVNAATVPLEVRAGEAGLGLRLEGDVRRPGLYPSDAWPAEVTLDGGDGPKAVTVVLADPVGNVSRPVTAVVELDRAPPAPGRVTLASGAEVVGDPVVPYTIERTDAERVRFWEVDPADDCGPATCAAEGFTPLSPLQLNAGTITLSPRRGPKRVCWLLCDRAGNAAPVGHASLTLGVHELRPRPVLAADAPLEPRAHVAFSNEAGEPPRYPLRVRGRGIAADTVVLLGDFELPCVSDGAEDCRADPDGGCGAAGRCAETCAETCVVALPDTLMRVAGTYVVRLRMPAPVAGGDGVSEAEAFFSVVGPVPALDDVRVLDPDPARAGSRAHGVIQEVDEEGAPVARTLRLEVAGRDLLDNAQFRLGPNFGSVETLERDPDDARRARAVVRVSTAAIDPRPDEPYPFVAVNPPPGGGESLPFPFGIHPPRSPCPGDGPCVGTLGPTRPRLPDDAGLFHAFAPTPSLRGAPGLVGRGGTALALRDRQGRLMARVEWPKGWGRAPMPLGDVSALVHEDLAGSSPGVHLEPARTRAATGAFEPEELLVAMSPTHTPEVADLDRDGVLDLVVPTAADEQLRILRGLGEGRFDDPIAVPMGAPPTEVRVFDLDADGHPDLVARPEGRPLAWRAGRGDLTFGPLQQGGIDTGIGEIAAVADLDRDGVADLAVPVSSWLLRTWHGDARGRLRPAEAVELPEGIFRYASKAVGDLDGDHVPDVVYAHAWTPTLRGRFGDGRGGFGPLTDLGAGLIDTTRTRIADLDLDGAADVLVLSIGGAPVLLVFGQGDGRLSPATRSVPLGVGRVARLRIDDLDDDQVPDLIFHTIGLAPVRWKVGDGRGGFGPIRTMGGEDTLVDTRPVDLDLDGTPDLLIARVNGVGWRRGIGRPAGGGLSARDHTAAHARFVTLADMDGDGILDLVTATGGPPEFRVYRGSGDGRFADPLVVPFAWRDNQGDWAVGDVNGDGRLDLVTVLARFGRPDGSFTRETGIGLRGRPNDLEILDLDGDGRDDLLASGWDHSGTTAWFQEPDGRFAGVPVVRGLPDHRYRMHGAGDLDGDGLVDVVLADPPAERARIFLQVAPRRFVRAAADALVPGLHHVEVADMDGDGHLDLLTTGEAPDEGVPVLAVRLGRGDGTFDAEPSAAVALDGVAAESPDAVRAADLNGDGLLDVVVALEEVGGFVMALGEPGGRLGPPWLFPLPSAPAGGLAVGDLDGNGVTDVVLTQHLASRVLVWLRAPSRTWRQVLRDMPAPRVPVGEGVTLSVHQAMQHVETVAARVRLTGEGLDTLHLTLRSPRGEEVAFDPPEGGREVVSVYLPPARTGAMAGWQPEGDWVLTVTPAAGAAAAAITDFRVLTTGTFVRAAP